MAPRRRPKALAAAALSALALSGIAALPAVAAPAADRPTFAGLRERLDRQTTLLVGFTATFEGQAARYYALAKGAGFDYAKLWRTKRAPVARLLADMKRTWIAGNPLYERMEGIVAGVPSLARYDVIIDAGSSAKEDPSSAVPFDLELPGGRVIRQPGNFYNITEGALWGTDAAFQAPGGVRADVNRNGRLEFGEALPDAAFLLVATREFDRYARELYAAARRYTPTAADAFTALVVMVPTMSEYFGQWKASRFIAGARTRSEAFNVVSRLSDINDIIGSLRVVYHDVQPLVAKESPTRAAQTKHELEGLAAFIQDLYRQERAGRRFTPQQAELLGTEAQERGTATAGQVSQSAARLGIKIQA
jgi:hypothetical protein